MMTRQEAVEAIEEEVKSLEKQREELSELIKAHPESEPELKIKSNQLRNIIWSLNDVKNTLEYRIEAEAEAEAEKKNETV